MIAWPLAAKTEKSVGVAKRKYLPELEALRTKQYAAIEKLKELKELKNASDYAWGVKVSADQAWDELRTSLANAALIFK